MCSHDPGSLNIISVKNEGASRVYSYFVLWIHGHPENISSELTVCDLSPTEDFSGEDGMLSVRSIMPGFICTGSSLGSRRYKQFYIERGLSDDEPRTCEKMWSEG
jgi:hypothetical protein